MMWGGASIILDLPQSDPFKLHCPFTSIHTPTKQPTRTDLHVVGQLRDVGLEAHGRGEGPKLGEVRAAEVDAVDHHHLRLCGVGRLCAGSGWFEFGW